MFFPLTRSKWNCPGLNGILQYLTENGCDTRDIFCLAVSTKELDALNYCAAEAFGALEYASSGLLRELLPMADIHCVAIAFKTALRNAKQPLIPPNLYASFLQLDLDSTNGIQVLIALKTIISR